MPRCPFFPLPFLFFLRTPLSFLSPLFFFLSDLRLACGGCVFLIFSFLFLHRCFIGRICQNTGRFAVLIASRHLRKDL
ncbi:hypothetical protein U713_05830 [Rhodobacter capsulatus YW2]|nr:hypothetical protein U713_05830 [Rhodobacter capsulatus YW2]